MEQNETKEEHLNNLHTTNLQKYVDNSPLYSCKLLHRFAVWTLNKNLVRDLKNSD